MSSRNKVVNEDVEAILSAFESDDFHLMNIFSNRLISDAVFSNNEASFIPGFFFKNVALTFQRLKYQKSDTISTAKSISRPILGDMKDLLKKGETEWGIYWAKYLEYHLRVKRFELNDIEVSIYSDNLEYTDLVFKWMIKFLEENMDLLKNDNNQLFSGILNEMDRVMRCHSGKIDHIVYSTLLRVLDNLYIYMLYVGDPETNKINEYLDRYINEFKTESIDYNSTHKLLKDCLIEWRKYYIRYMDIAIQRRQIQRGFKLPEEVEEKLTDSISKTLEEEIKEES